MQINPNFVFFTHTIFYWTRFFFKLVDLERRRPKLLSIENVFSKIRPSKFPFSTFYCNFCFFVRLKHNFKNHNNIERIYNFVLQLFFQIRQLLILFFQQLSRSKNRLYSQHWRLLLEISKLDKFKNKRSFSSC